jgi:hypothetical protein
MHYGLLMLLTMCLVDTVLFGLPLTADTASWYFPTSTAAVVSVALLIAGAAAGLVRAARMPSARGCV